MSYPRVSYGALFQKLRNISQVGPLFSLTCLKAEIRKRDLCEYHNSDARSGREA